MELISTVTTTWKICIIASLMSFLMLLLLLNENRSMSTAKSAIIEFHAPPPKTAVSFTALKVTSLIFATTSPPSSNNFTTTSFDHVIEKFSDKNNDKREKINVSYVDNNKIRKAEKKKVKKECNMFDGKWVYKAEMKPSYMAWQCPFLEEKMSCQRNRRPDLEYEKWVWEARDCHIPMLNGTDMVERFRNKRVVLIGDSLNRNMWESLACILYSSIPNASSKVVIRYNGKMKRSFLIAKDDYNFTVEFFWSPFLVEHNIKHDSGKRVLVLDNLSPNSKTWAGADIMVFNSAHWWGLLGSKKAWDLYEYKGKLTDLPLHIAYKRAMSTWKKWVEENIDPTKTALFFRSVSAEHLSIGNDQWCFRKTRPIMDESYKPLFPISLIRGIESIIKSMKKSQVKYLNITKLSEYRIDAHPSIFRYKNWKTRAKKDLRNLTSTADCGHWCLPGIPDTWNRLLYASLYFDSFEDISTF